MTPLLLLMLLPACLGAFLQPLACSEMPQVNKLDFTVVDVALDDDHKLLKFFINAKVIDASNITTSDVLISDVNSTTNRYTTFHSEIAFRGVTFVNENRRFCDMLGVKNNSNFLQSPRFRARTNSTIYVGPSGPMEVANGVPIGHKAIAQLPIQLKENDVEPDYASYASSNETIEWLFSNSTGDFYSCPLYSNDSIYIYYQVDISPYSHQLGSFTARFSVVSNNDEGELLDCFRLYITPKLPNRIDRPLLIGVLALILITGLINFLTIIYSSYQESSNPFLFLASTICNAKLLKQLDATVQRIIMYLQFALFTGGLNLKYPGFYQPIVASLRWCALMGFNFIRTNDHSSDADNVYLTLGGGGLKALAFFSTFQTIGTNWFNFIFTLVCWIGIQIASQLIFMFLREFASRVFRPHRDIQLSYQRTLHYIAGIFTNNIICLFGYPFLILTLFTFYLSNNMAPYNPVYNKSVDAMKKAMFSKNMSSDEFFRPDTRVELINNTTDVSYIDQRSGRTFNVSSPATAYKVVTRGDNIPVGAIAAGSVLLAMWFGIALYFIFKYLITIRKWRVVTNTNISKLYISVNTILVWSNFYHHYSPEKTYFVILDLVALASKSLVVSCAQNNGLVQVVCMILIEAMSCFLLFTIQPYYLPFTFTTTRWIIPVARFLIALLCIPFLEELNLSENTRSNVAFVHLIIHLIVALFFIIQLLYCFSTTVLSIIREKREKLKTKLNRTPSIQSEEFFNRQFEYQPVGQTLLRAPKYLENMEGDHQSLSELMTQRQPSPLKINPDDTDNYFRAQSETVLQRVQHKETCAADIFTLNSDVSFERQQEFSNKRKECVDYTTREGDLIYKKYFVDDKIDPEMKELWETRQKRQDEAFYNNSQSTEKRKGKTLNTKLKAFFNKPNEKCLVTGFQVSRPKQIVVIKPPRCDDASIRSSCAPTERESEDNFSGDPSEKTTTS